MPRFESLFLALLVVFPQIMASWLHTLAELSHGLTRLHDIADFLLFNFQRAISNIEARLQGVVVGVGAAPSLPLAVEGQARRLISEAVSLKNLGKMYIWWMPWF